MSGLRRLLSLLSLLMIFAGYQVRPALAVEGGNPETELLEVEDILALNTTMRSMLDLFVKPIPNKEHRAQALYNLMFGSDKFALQYDGSLTKTKTAIETVESGSGNCVSLSNVFIAMARYVNLNASYLDVEMPRVWERESDVYYQMKHVSATVRIAPDEYLGIEYRWMGSITSAKTRIIDDKKAFAAFFSNRGVEMLAQGKTDAAIAYLKRSIELDPSNGNNWSNLGVTYRRLNRLDDAENAYVQALKKNKGDLTALNNLSYLYRITGRANLAEKYARRLERYRMQNPYYVIDQAKLLMKAGDYDEALRLARKAIDKYDDEDEFYFVAAQIHALQGNMEQARENLQKAERYALTAMSRDRYSRKLDVMGRKGDISAN